MVILQITPNIINTKEMQENIHSKHYQYQKKAKYRKWHFPPVLLVLET